MSDLSSLKISARLIAEEAVRRGWKVTVIAEGYSYILIHHPDLKRPLLMRSTVGDMTSFAAGGLCDNKWAFHCLLESSKLPVPATIRIQYSDPNLENLTIDWIKTYKKVVIKPIDANHGEGITMDVTHITDALEAINLTKAFTKDDGFLIQEQCDGNDYRFLVVNGNFIAASGRKPAFVIGDGRQTVEELVKKRIKGHYEPKATTLHLLGLALI